MRVAHLAWTPNSFADQVLIDASIPCDLGNEYTSAQRHIDRLKQARFGIFCIAPFDASNSFYFVSKILKKTGIAHLMVFTY